MKNTKKMTKPKSQTKKTVKKVTKKPEAKKEMRKETKEENKTGVTPLNDRVLVKPIDVTLETKTASGIIIPDTVSKEKPEQGEIMAIGKKVEADLKVGDKVVFSRYGFDDIKVNGVEYYILKEENILAVVR